MTIHGRFRRPLTAVLVASGLAVAASATMASATVIVQDLSGNDVSQVFANTQNHWGESFTTPTAPAGTTYDHLTFSLYDANNNPVAAGSGYIRSSPYAKEPDQLAAPPALAVSTSSSGGAWTFDPNFKLAPGTTYYFYEDAPIDIVRGGDKSSGQTYWQSSAHDLNFLLAKGMDINYSLSGQINSPLSGAPEPAIWLLLTASIGGVGAALRSRRRAKAPAA